ncbi:hypothetical protein AZ78_4075 [Lysobacter capsici AZ78]|uniref:Uncharacterized protein n=1 Tax=Lysobacter capsici AZ78 TaxID=1444315 RepID=A0A108UC92_9GAMM|nr:hypothetical protein AZ78_4075 [Lysobacter capsici AZ78]
MLLPPLAGEGWDGGTPASVPSPAAPGAATSPAGGRGVSHSRFWFCSFPRLRGKAGMGALSSVHSPAAPGAATSPAGGRGVSHSRFWFSSFPRLRGKAGMGARRPASPHPPRQVRRPLPQAGEVFRIRGSGLVPSAACGGRLGWGCAVQRALTRRARCGDLSRRRERCFRMVRGVTGACGFQDRDHRASRMASL